MNHLKRLVVSLSLISVLTVTAFAGEIQTPPCAPGEMQTPPCSSAPLIADDPVDEGQPSTPPAGDTIDLSSVAADVISVLLVLV
jgi:hypothetical protein